MRRFWENKGNDEKNNQLNNEPQQEINKNQERLNRIEQELDCEELLTNEKRQFGRIRTTTLKYLRTKYGKELTNRVQWRINKRQTSMKIN